MAIVSSYPQGTPTLNDTVIGTQYVENKEPVTKQFNINDIVDLVPVVYTQLPYKVFTALLTQSGGDNITSIGGGLLTIGVTYLINDLEGVIGADFTNVGAPNNNIGTYFVATGTTPIWGINPIGVGILLYNDGAPVVTVLENTIGNIWFSYDAVATYGINSDNLFINNKTYITNLTPTDTDYQRVYGGNSFIIDINKLGITTLEIPNIMTDGLLNNTPIEIRVYN